MDRNKFNDIITRMRPKLYRFALSLVGQADLADDMVQDVVVRLWEHKENIDAYNNLEAYAMRAVKNRCVDYTRSKVYQTVELKEVMNLSVEQTPYHQTELKDTTGRIHKIINDLSLLQQMVIRLRDIEGYELNEIADILEINNSAVRTNLSRARQKIRDELLKQTII